MNSKYFMIFYSILFTISIVSFFWLIWSEYIPNKKLYTKTDCLIIDKSIKAFICKSISNFSNCWDVICIFELSYKNDTYYSTSHKMYYDYESALVYYDTILVNSTTIPCYYERNNPKDTLSDTHIDYLIFPLIIVLTILTILSFLSFYFFVFYCCKTYPNFTCFVNNDKNYYAYKPLV